MRVAGICMRLKRPNRVRSKKNIRSSAQTHCGGAKLEWEGPRVVLFEYNHAEIQNFRNFWNVVDPPTLDPSGKAEDFIEIRLVARPGDS